MDLQRNRAVSIPLNEGMPLQQLNLVDAEVKNYKGFNPSKRGPASAMYEIDQKYLKQIYRFQSL